MTIKSNDDIFVKEYLSVEKILRKIPLEYTNDLKSVLNGTGIVRDFFRNKAYNIHPSDEKLYIYALQNEAKIVATGKEMYDNLFFHTQKVYDKFLFFDEDEISNKKLKEIVKETISREIFEKFLKHEKEIVMYNTYKYIYNLGILKVSRLQYNYIEDIFYVDFTKRTFESFRDDVDYLLTMNLDDVNEAEYAIAVVKEKNRIDTLSEEERNAELKKYNIEANISK